MIPTPGIELPIGNDVSLELEPLYRETSLQVLESEMTLDFGIDTTQINNCTHITSNLIIFCIHIAVVSFLDQYIGLFLYSSPIQEEANVLV